MKSIYKIVKHDEDVIRYTKDPSKNVVRIVPRIWSYGGEIYTIGNYKFHVFRHKPYSNYFQKVEKDGSIYDTCEQKIDTFSYEMKPVIPELKLDVSIFVIGGGGHGGQSSQYAAEGGGGGAGGMTITSMILDPCVNYRCEIGRQSWKLEHPWTAQSGYGSPGYYGSGQGGDSYFGTYDDTDILVAYGGGANWSIPRWGDIGRRSAAGGDFYPAYQHPEYPYDFDPSIYYPGYESSVGSATHYGHRGGDAWQGDWYPTQQFGGDGGGAGADGSVGGAGKSFNFDGSTTEYAKGGQQSTAAMGAYAGCGGGGSSGQMAPGYYYPGGDPLGNHFGYPGASGMIVVMYQYTNNEDIIYVGEHLSEIM